MKTIYLWELESLKADPNQIKILSELFGEKLYFTKEIALKHAKNIDWNWLAKNFFPQKNYIKYKNKVSKLNHEFEKNLKRISNEFDDSIADASNSLNLVRKSASNKRDKITENALKKYKTDEAEILKKFTSVKGKLIRKYRTEKVQTLDGYEDLVRETKNKCGHDIDLIRNKRSTISSAAFSNYREAVRQEEEKYNKIRRPFLDKYFNARNEFCNKITKDIALVWIQIFQSM